MTTSTSKKTNGAQKKTTTKATSKAVPKAASAPRRTAAPKAPAMSNASTPVPRHATVEDSDEDDDELGYVGSTLDSNGDAIMEEVDGVDKGVGADAMDITDDEDGEEDEESELSESIVILH